MSRGQSSCPWSCNSRGSQNPSSSNHGGGFSSHSGGFSSHGGAPYCNYGQVAMLRTARTAKVGDRQFWGCPNYKVRSIPHFFIFVHE